MLSRATHPQYLGANPEARHSWQTPTTEPFLFVYFLFEDSLRAADTVPLPNNGFNPKERRRNRKLEGDRLELRDVHLQTLELGVRGVGSQMLGQIRLSQVRKWELVKIPGWPRSYSSGLAS